MRTSYLTTCLALAALSGMFLFTGCSKKIEGNEKTHPIYIKAKNDRDTGRFRDAADGLNDLLSRAPKSAFLHKELATLYGDNMDEDYKAIYHYQRYLDLEKLSSEDQRQIRSYIAACKRRAAERMIQEDPTLAAPQRDGASGSLDQATMDKLNKLSFLEQHNKKLVETFKVYAAQVSALKKENAELKAAAASAGKTASAASAASASSANAAVTESAAADGDIYVVQSGDTLSRIAMKNYGSKAEKFQKLIREANGLTSNSIKAGQKLKIPKLPR